ncbi:hypothetical protein ACRALDRAFT_208881 [Sodiomyces alcalophilus JCM 7366]|uniref:uncharacterized protein n=1 Tax=Sodiomyces alcalophilus JCM 7366 TaxID=591952 RepID=UPI0039B47E7A
MAQAQSRTTSPLVIPPFLAKGTDTTCIWQISGHLWNGLAPSFNSSSPPEFTDVSSQFPLGRQSFYRIFVDSAMGIVSTTPNLLAQALYPSPTFRLGLLYGSAVVMDNISPISCACDHNKYSIFDGVLRNRAKEIMIHETPQMPGQSNRQGIASPKEYCIPETEDLLEHSHGSKAAAFLSGAAHWSNECAGRVTCTHLMICIGSNIQERRKHLPDREKKMGDGLKYHVRPTITSDSLVWGHSRYDAI